MWSSWIVIAEGGMSWTPETFYIAAAVAQLVAVLLVFRILQLPSEYNTFINALFVVIPTNVAAYYLAGAGLVGVLVTGTMLFVLLALIARGDMLNSCVAWVVLVALYWVLAYFIVPEAEDLEIGDLGNIPQVLIEGGLEEETLEREDLGVEDENDD